VYSSPGLGQTPADFAATVPAPAVSADSGVTYPWYCSFFPVGSACQPPSQAQLQAMQQAQLAQIAAINPDLAAAGLQAGDQAVAAYLAQNPSEASDYYAAVNSPVLYSVVGGTAANWLNGIDPSTGLPVSGIPGWIWIAIAGLAALFLVKR